MDMEKKDTMGRAAIVSLFDEGTFVEMGAFVRRQGETYDAVLCGYGAVGGKLTFAFAQDADRQKGAFDAVGAAKIARLYEQAVRTGAPVVGVLNSAGRGCDRRGGRAVGIRTADEVRVGCLRHYPAGRAG